MLTSLLAALPANLPALVLIGLAYIVARLLGGFVAGILADLGFDRLLPSWVSTGIPSCRKPQPTRAWTNRLRLR
jgi:hypothetical protein